jgi:stearoyl-CoA desaturase (delta-9 desaturase)
MARKFRKPAGLTLILVHILGFASLFLVTFEWWLVGLCIGMYYLRMFGITAGFHRYFSHKSFKTSRPMQFVLAWIGTSAIQRGPIWWAAIHRHHHKHSDTPKDLHSPRQQGLWQAHLGWVLKKENRQIDRTKVADLTRFPEIDWIDRHYLVPPLSMAVLIFLVWGLPGLVYGFFLSTILLWHGTFTINSLSHVFGRRPYNTRDDSRNSALLAIVTMGEGWHNNHHFYPASARQGFTWWQFDASFLILRIFKLLGLVWDVKVPPRELVTAGMVDAIAESKAL